MTETPEIPLPRPDSRENPNAPPPDLILPAPSPEEQQRFHAQYARRILTYTCIAGLAAALATLGLARKPLWAAGIAVGTALAMVNFRWLDQALGGLVTAAQAQEGLPKPVVPLSLYAKFIGRYLLIGIGLCVMVMFFRVPIVACLTGLLALGAGTIAAALYDVISGNR
jgi:hypothetical protein